MVELKAAKKERVRVVVMCSRGPEIYVDATQRRQEGRVKGQMGSEIGNTKYLYSRSNSNIPSRMNGVLPLEGIVYVRFPRLQLDGGVTLLSC